ncbi:MAG: hypothetical protein LBT13_01290 [Treponema sp.]|jgi:hypothetical protein|nr:hypothetical protein [Treponema sp.]
MRKRNALVQKEVACFTVQGYCCLALVFFCVAGRVCALGTSEAKTEKTPQNGEWVLAVTAFDISALPISRQQIGEDMTRRLIRSLGAVHTRSRMVREYAYYGDYAWSKTRAVAAQTLAAKRGERDLLVYQGDPEWKYRKRLKVIDAEIQKLEEALIETEAEIPLIVLEPGFKLTEENIKGSFPVPPAEGGEYRFCVTQKADAFLTGKIIEFHGRFYVTLRMYTRYTRSFQYEDSVVFSTETTDQMVNTLANRLVATVSGMPLGAVVVHTVPEDARVFIDSSLAGQAETIERPAGTIEIESFADQHEAVSIPLELKSGELAELYINLQPLSHGALNITVPDKPGASVYRGALYIGQTPLSMDTPMHHYEYYRVETPEGEHTSVVLSLEDSRTKSALQGTAEAGGTLVLKTRKPPPEGTKPVEKARRRFYGAYGRFWITLPVAFVIQGIYSSQIAGYQAQPTVELYEDIMVTQKISIGAWIVFGAVSAEFVVRTVLYLYNGWKDAPQLARSTQRKGT